MSVPRACVAVCPPAALEARPRLFAALAQVLPVAFVPWAEDAAPPDAVVAIGVHPPDDAVATGLPSFTAGDRPSVAGSRESSRIGDGAEIDRRLRGIELAGAPATPFEPVAAGDAVLATSFAGAVWTRAGAARHRVAVALEELPLEQSLRNLILYGRPLGVVALVAFLRELVGGGGWSPPPLRASIVFDDPNVRLRTYGYIDYDALLRHADEHGYHVAMAMVPLDARGAHRATRALFAARPDRLSLVVHGNDHVRRELMTPADHPAAMALAAQAVRRIVRFERRTGLSVDRVMVPPHGLCAKVMSDALGAVGFDALCAIHPLPWTEDAPADHPAAGWSPAQFVSGCAVIPRFPLDCAPDEIALRAFLDQPLVFYGHHGDVAGGLEPLAQAARIAERLGEVRWMSLGEIATSNYALYVEGECAAIRPFARRLEVELPQGVERLRVLEPGAAVDGFALTGWGVDGDPIQRFGAEIPAAGSLEIRLHGPHDADPASIAGPSRSIKPRMRRAAAEIRDRALPLWPRGENVRADNI